MATGMNADIIIRHIIAEFRCVNQESVIRRVNARAPTILRKPTRGIKGKALREAFPGLSGS